MVTIPKTVPLMHKDIIFLLEVKASTRQKVINFVKEWNSTDEWITVNTSGSTGKPKAIKLLKQQMVASANATIQFFNLQPNQTILLTLSPDYIAGKMMMVRALINQMKIVVAPIQSNPLLLDIEQSIDFSAFVPMQVQTILGHPKSKLNYEHIKTVIIGGGAINKVLEKQIQSLTNQNYATFGMTETISHIALRNINAKEECFTALPNVTFSTHRHNCLTINAPKICNHPLLTHDCVDLLNDKQFKWKGRQDFAINSGGIKLHPEEIEQKIAPYIKESRFYLIGEQDNLLGEKLILKIEGNQFNLEALKQKLKSVLTKFEQPKRIDLISNFQETKTGKIIRS